MLRNLDPDKYDIACIQEPYLNPVNLANASNLSRFWDVVYPSNHHSNQTRSQTLILVNKRISKNNWHIIHVNSPNVMAIELTSPYGKVRIYNVYNKCENDSILHFMERHMRTENNARHNREGIAQGENQPEEHVIWLGDFNRHHPMWELANNTHLFTAANLDAAGTLINLLALYNMSQILPPGIATLEASNTKNLTRPDNVFCSEGMEQVFTQCEVMYHLRPVVTDHFPIISSLDLSPERINTTPRLNYRAADWDTFNEALEQRLATHPPAELTSVVEFETAFTKLTQIIADTVNEQVPRVKPSPYSKRWWSKDLDKERKSVHKLGRESRHRLAQRNHPTHEEYRIARNRFSESIKKAKEEHWKTWLESLTSANMWDFHRYAASNPADQIQTRIKTLKDPRNEQQDNTTQDNARKSELLYQTFFRQPPEDDHVDPNFIYEAPICEFRPITNQQIYRAIARLSPHKAPGPNEIGNIVFMKSALLIVPYLGPLFRATFTLKVYPEQWKRSSTIVLRKPGRPDYSLPKAYRPITLLDTMAKILSSCVADDLTYITERHNLLPATHFGGRPGRSTTDSLHVLTKFITDAWASKNCFVSVLFLDVKAAFPSVVVRRLLHNLKKARIPEEYIEWYKIRLANRTTTLCFDDYVSNSFDVQDGVDQGCPLSPLAFIFYNSDVLNVADTRPSKGELSLGFIDDVAITAKAETYEEANTKLANMMTKPGGALAWSEEHNAEFELDKTALICLSRKRIPNPTNLRKTVPVPRPSITISGHVIQPSSSHKFLGVIIDQELRFKEHADYALAKGTKYTLACNRMIRPTKGLRGKWMRRLYQGVIVPKMLYAADIWCAGILAKGKSKKAGGRGARGFASKMARVQRMAALLITGAMRSTPTDLLDIHANIKPFQQNLRQICHRAMLRLVTLHENHPLYKSIKSAYNFHAKREFKKEKRHPSPIHKLTSEFKLNPSTIETIQPVRHYTKWIPDVEVRIAASKTAAYYEDELAEEELRVYSDGSAIEEGVGAAAVLMDGERKVEERRFHLGGVREHTMYEGEIVGMLLAVQLLKEEVRRRGNVPTMALGVDNQAAVRATMAFQSKPGHYLMDMFHDELRELLTDKENETHKLVVRWSAGHIGIEGNEEADKEAKEAARGNSSDGHLLPKSLRKADNSPATLPRSKSAIKQAFDKTIADEAASIMRLSPRYERFKEIDPRAPSKTFSRIVDHLPRRHSSLLVQLRTGHVPLNKHLHRIARSPSPRCPSCQEREESVHHFLFVCPTYVTHRRKLKAELGTRAQQLKHLLNDEKCIESLFKYIARTKRFVSTFGDVTPPEKKKDRNGQRT